MNLENRIKQLESEIQQLKGEFEPYGFNGNSEGCDTMNGPCACGSFHSYSSPPPNLTKRGKQALQDMKVKRERVLDRLMELL